MLLHESGTKTGQQLELTVGCEHVVDSLLVGVGKRFILVQKYLEAVHTVARYFQLRIGDAVRMVVDPLLTGLPRLRRLVWALRILPQHALRSESWIHFGPAHDLYFIYGEKVFREVERLQYEQYDREAARHE